MDYNLILTIISLILAVIAVYSTHFRPARIKISAGHRIALWHHNNNIAFDVPLTFFNVGTRPGTIHSMAIVIFNIEDKKENILLKWLYFLKFNPSSDSWDKDDLSTQISINQNSTLFKCVNFKSWEGKVDWIPKLGEYKFIILGWHKKSKKPTIKTEFIFNLDEKQTETIKKNVLLKNTWNTYIFRPGFGEFTAKKLSRKELTKIIG